MNTIKTIKRSKSFLKMNTIQKLFLILTFLASNLVLANQNFSGEAEFVQYVTSNPGAAKQTVAKIVECNGKLKVALGGHFGSNKLESCSPEVAALKAMEHCMNEGLSFCHVYNNLIRCHVEIVNSAFGGNFGSRVNVCKALYRGLRLTQEVQPQSEARTQN